MASDDDTDEVQVLRANKRLGEVNEVPDGYVIVEQESEPGVEILKITEGFECDECGDTFDTEAGLSGHLSSHSDN